MADRVKRLPHGAVPFENVGSFAQIREVVMKLNENILHLEKRVKELEKKEKK
jgi:hypothetical protein